jgi:hypothetical protein
MRFLPLTLQKFPLAFNRLLSEIIPSFSDKTNAQKPLKLIMAKKAKPDSFSYAGTLKNPIFFSLLKNR